MLSEYFYLADCVDLPRYFETKEGYKYEHYRRS